ncbi:MAG TPA: HepT-like ribonuclease domain-containing protein [Dehalococcoidia bacterium]|nr:HepT-like ribonuclease domain-containing protein [Dehalococcoidia bacterium]
MLIAARKSRQFTAGVSQERFASDEVLQHAVLRMLQIIGEAATKLSAQRRESIAAVPWDKVIGLRHRLVHEYFNINLPLIWQVLNEDVPLLIDIIEALVPPEDA